MENSADTAKADLQAKRCIEEIDRISRTVRAWHVKHRYAELWELISPSLGEEELAAACCQHAGLQPSEFKRLNRSERLPFLEIVAERLKLAPPGKVRAVSVDLKTCEITMADRERGIETKRELRVDEAAWIAAMIEADGEYVPATRLGANMKARRILDGLERRLPEVYALIEQGKGPVGARIHRDKLWL